MKHRATMQRWTTAAAAAGALILASGTAAQAAPAQGTQQTATHSATASGTENRFVQGKNFCLLSFCEVGGEQAGHGQGGILGIQGWNVCLLSTCSVRG